MTRSLMRVDNLIERLRCRGQRVQYSAGGHRARRSIRSVSRTGLTAPLLATFRPRLTTSRRSSGAIDDGAAAVAIGDGAATAMAVIDAGAAADGGGGKLPNLRPQH